MKRPILVLPCALASLAVLAGCTSGPNTPATSNAVDTAAPTAAPTTASAAAAEALPTAGTTDEPTPAATEGGLASPQGGTNLADGAAVKKVGEKVTVKTTSGLDYLTFSFTKFTPDYQCPNEFHNGKGAEHGQFLAVEVSATAGSKAAVAESGLGGKASFPALIFKAQDADGTSTTDVIGNSLMCQKAATLMPSRFDPEESVTGLLVFDVPKHGTLLAPDSRTMNGTWAWKF